MANIPQWAADLDNRRGECHSCGAVPGRAVLAAHAHPLQCRFRAPPCGAGPVLSRGR